MCCSPPHCEWYQYAEMLVVHVAGYTVTPFIFAAIKARDFNIMTYSLR